MRRRSLLKRVVAGLCSPIIPFYRSKPTKTFGVSAEGKTRTEIESLRKEWNSYFTGRNRGTCISLSKKPED